MADERVNLNITTDGITNLARELQKIGQLQTTLGASPGQAAGLAALGSAVGFNAGSLALSSYQQTLSGLGAARASQAGLVPEFGVSRPVNYAERTIRLLEEMVRIFDKYGRQEALLFARQTGIEDSFQANYMSPGLRRVLLERRPPELSAEAQRVLADIQAIPPLILRGIKVVGAEMLALRLHPLYRAFDFFSAPLQLPGSIWRLRHPQEAAARDKALERNSKAVEENTLQIRQVQGIFGGGARVRTAIPAAFGFGNGFMLNGAYRAFANKLGAFSVSR